VVTSYLLDGDEEVAEYSDATLMRRYVDGPTIDDRIAHVEGSATLNPPKTYYHVDHHGSVVAVTDAAGNVSQRMSYDEYGNFGANSSDGGEAFRYTGRRYDIETGLYYYRARYYSPRLGRFLQADPVGYEADLDLYSYGGNDPLDRVDPSGKYDDAMGNYYPGTEELPGDFNPLEHPVATAGVLGATIAAPVCLAGGCEALAGADLLAGAQRSGRVWGLIQKLFGSSEKAEDQVGGAHGM